MEELDGSEKGGYSFSTHNDNSSYRIESIFLRKHLSKRLRFAAQNGYEPVHLLFEFNRNPDSYDLIEIVPMIPEEQLHFAMKSDNSLERLSSRHEQELSQ